jgi:low affinity Fe/Cu permease
MGAKPPPEMPSEISGDLGVFDRFATHASNIASRAVFFTLCVLLVVLWAPSLLIFRDVDTWQLIINTATTIITFLLVALLQNSQTRSERAIQHKLNAIADGLADLMDEQSNWADSRKLRKDVEELRAAVGLEQRESTSDNRNDHDSSSAGASRAPHRLSAH